MENCFIDYIYLFRIITITWAPPRVAADPTPRSWTSSCLTRRPTFFHAPLSTGKDTQFSFVHFLDKLMTLLPKFWLWLYLREQPHLCRHIVCHVEKHRHWARVLPKWGPETKNHQEVDPEQRRLRRLKHRWRQGRSRAGVLIGTAESYSPLQVNRVVTSKYKTETF